MGVEPLGFLLDAVALEFLPLAVDEGRSQVQHCLRPSQRPAHPRTFHAILDHVTACPFDHAAGNRLTDEKPEPPHPCETWYADLWLQPDIFPIRRYSQFEDPLNRNATDPLGGILAALSTGRSDVVRPIVEIIARPARPRRVKHARSVLRHLASPFFRSHPTLARLYARAVTSRWWFPRIVGRVFGFLVHF